MNVFFNLRKNDLRSSGLLIANFCTHYSALKHKGNCGSYCMCHVILLEDIIITIKEKTPNWHIFIQVVCTLSQRTHNLFYMIA